MSSTAALVDLMKFLYVNTDSPKQAVRLWNYELSKGCDRVDHNILIDILEQLDIHPSSFSCIQSLLMGRHQRVCISDHISSWKSRQESCRIVCLIPPSSSSGRWKYMDDLTVAESFSINQDQSDMQASAEWIAQHANNHPMKPDLVKCKEMLVCFQRLLPEIPKITNADDQLKRVTTYRLLGVHITNDLTWNYYINAIT